MLLEQILKELKTKYKDLGLGDDYLKVIAKRLARTVKEESEISDAVADLEDEMKFQQSQNDTLRTLKNQIKKFEEGGKNQEGKDEKKELKQETEDKKPTEDVPVWVATGGKGNLKFEVLAPIINKEIVLFPDAGEYKFWHDIGQRLNDTGFNITTSHEMESHPIGTDLADLIINKK